MLHRMALRVLPSLSLAVTEDSVRRRKRLVMFVPGLVGFIVYRVAKPALPLSEPLVLLSVGGLFALATALVAYRVGRDASWAALAREDGFRLLAWLGGWIGAVYGVQLSLLVLALLWLVGYDYLRHPDGPAMMAIIISSTAVARDAFEIGYVRRIGILGRPCPTFPNGVLLRRMLANHVSSFVPWVVAGIPIGAVAASLGQVAEGRQAAIAQLSAVTLLGGALALCAYLDAWRPERFWMDSLRLTAPWELLKYWWWPGMAFASTYYLVIMGLILFVGRQPSVMPLPAVMAGGLVAAMMGLYGYYLGHRRQVEDQQRPQLSSGMLRCPFVMGILGRTAGTAVEAGNAAGELVSDQSGSKG